MREVVQVRDVVALEFETGAVRAAARENRLDVGERVLEHEVAALFQMFAFPRMPEFAKALEHRIQAEVHRAHVQRSDFGLEMMRGAQALGDRHVRAAARRDVDHRVGARLDARQELGEHGRVLRRPAVGRIAGVQVQDRRARFGRRDRRFLDLARRDG